VTDAACFPSQGNQNPTLTILALIARACDHALQSSRGSSTASENPNPPEYGLHTESTAPQRPRKPVSPRTENCRVVVNIPAAKVLYEKRFREKGLCHLISRQFVIGRAHTPCVRVVLDNDFVVLMEMATKCSQSDVFKYLARQPPRNIVEFGR
jgi:hypothetical protein